MRSSRSIVRRAPRAALRLHDFFEGFLAANRVDGQLVGIPWYVDTRVLFYRRDLLRQAGFDRAAGPGRNGGDDGGIKTAGRVRTLFRAAAAQ